jgi:hypothetical protein
MDIDLARHVVRVAFRAMGDLQGLLGVLEERCSPEEYKSLALGIAEAIDAIGVALTNKALSAHPALAAEIDAAIARQGRYE